MADLPYSGTSNQQTYQQLLLKTFPASFCKKFSDDSPSPLIYRDVFHGNLLLPGTAVTLESFELGSKCAGELVQCTLNVVLLNETLRGR